MRFPPTGDEDGLIRLGIARLRLRPRFLHFENAEVPQLDADVRIGFHHELTDGTDDGSDPRFTFVDRFIHDVRNASGYVFLGQRFGFAGHVRRVLKVRFRRARQVTDLPPENQGFQEFIAISMRPRISRGSWPIFDESLGVVALLFKPVHAVYPFDALDAIDQPAKVVEVLNVEDQITLEDPIVGRNGDGSDVGLQVL